jgi:hypothetical protein
MQQFLGARLDQQAGGVQREQGRAIEAEINERCDEPDRHSNLHLTNFRGIELRDPRAEFARLSLVITDQNGRDPL